MSLADILHSGERSLLHSSMTGLAGRLPSRRIPTFAGSQYGTIDTLITFTGDFEVEVEFASTDTALVGKGLFGYSIAGTTNFLQITNPAGQINFTNTDGAVAWTHANAHLDGKIHKVTVYRSGLTIGLKLDGVIKASNTLGAASTVDIDIIGALGIATIISQQFNGQILSAKFTDAGTVVDNFVFDSGSITDQPSRGGGNNVTLINFATTDWNPYTLQRNITHDTGTIAEAWVGGNLVVNGGFDADTDWTKSAGVTISGGVLATDGTTTGELSRQSGIGLGALPYLLSIDVISLSAGSLGSKQGGGTVRYSSSLGTFKNFSTDGTLDNIQILGLSAAVGSVDNVKAQHLLEVA